MKHILLLEDNLELASMMIKELEFHGYEVDHADSIRKALQLILTNNHDLLISDIMLPYTGGLDLVEVLREDASFRKPIIIVTGMDKDILNSTRIDVDRIITKPFKMSELIDAIQEQFEREPATQMENVSVKNSPYWE